MRLTDEQRNRLTNNERDRAEALAAGQTVVVNVRRNGPHRRLVPLLVEQELLTYVGRSSSRHSWPASDFANPFLLRHGLDRTTMMSQYAQWLDGQPALLRRIYDGELTGRALGCWCVPSQPCHAEILARLASKHR